MSSIRTITHYLGPGWGPGHQTTNADWSDLETHVEPDPGDSIVVEARSDSEPALIQWGYGGPKVYLMPGESYRWDHGKPPYLVRL